MKCFLFFILVNLLQFYCFAREDGFRVWRSQIGADANTVTMEKILDSISSLDIGKKKYSLVYVGIADFRDGKIFENPPRKRIKGAGVILEFSSSVKPAEKFRIILSSKTLRPIENLSILLNAPLPIFGSESYADFNCPPPSYKANLLSGKDTVELFKIALHRLGEFVDKYPGFEDFRKPNLILNENCLREAQKANSIEQKKKWINLAESGLSPETVWEKRIALSPESVSTITSQETT